MATMADSRSVGFADRHGGNVWSAAARLACDPVEICDFSANINPIGLPASARQAALAAIDRSQFYPDRSYASLRVAAANRFDMAPASISVGNGASELLDALCRCHPWRQVHIWRPCYGEYAGAATRAHLPVTATDVFLPGNIGLAIESLPAGFPDELPKGVLVFVGCPNNPTGTLVAPKVLAELAERCAQADGLLVVDTSFLDFCPDGADYRPTPLIQAGLPVVEVISLTKIYAMPGLRLGIAIAAPKWANLINEHLPPWNVNAVAAAAGAAALSDTLYLEQTHALIPLWRRRLLKSLALHGWSCACPAAANFCLLDPHTPGRALVEKLEQFRILVRNTVSFVPLGDRFLRLAVRPLHEQERLLNAIGGLQ